MESLKPRPRKCPDCGSEITESPTSDGGYGLGLIVYGGGGRYQTEIGQTPQK